MWMCTHGYLVNCAVKDSDGSSQPSRWQGRCVDYALSTQAGLLSAPSYWDDVLSDHKIYMVSLHLGYEEAFNDYMAPTKSYLKPDGISSDVWRKPIARYWQHANAISATTTEEEWYSFHAVVASLKTGSPRSTAPRTSCH